MDGFGEPMKPFKLYSNYSGLCLFPKRGPIVIQVSKLSHPLKCRHHVHYVSWYTQNVVWELYPHQPCWGGEIQYKTTTCTTAHDCPTWKIWLLPREQGREKGKESGICGLAPRPGWSLKELLRLYCVVQRLAVLSYRFLFALLAKSTSFPIWMSFSKLFIKNLSLNSLN